jgi:signal transduction histidine kinase
MIEDNGCGIEKKLISKIIEPFFSTTHNNTGLGLSSTYSYIKSLNGDFIIKSKKNEWTKIIIILKCNCE